MYVITNFHILFLIMIIFFVYIFLYTKDKVALNSYKEEMYDLLECTKCRSSYHRLVFTHTKEIKVVCASCGELMIVLDGSDLEMVEDIE